MVVVTLAQRNLVLRMLRLHRHRRLVPDLLLRLLPNYHAPVNLSVDVILTVGIDRMNVGNVLLGPPHLCAHAIGSVPVMLSVAVILNRPVLHQRRRLVHVI